MPDPYSYDLMADDVVALFDALKLPKTDVVGWSDGAVIGLDLAMRHPNRVGRIVAFGANTAPSGMKEDYKNPNFLSAIARAEQHIPNLFGDAEGISSLLRSNLQNVGRPAELDRCTAQVNNRASSGYGWRP